MSKSSLSAIKAATQSKALEDQHSSERKRDALVLILTHLREHGYIETATALIRESVSLKKYEQADNLDLMQILKEYDEFYEVRFGRRPTFCRHVQHQNSGVLVNSDDNASVRKHNAYNKRRSKNKNPANEAEQRNHKSILPQLYGSSQQLSQKGSDTEVSKLEEKCSELARDDGITGFSLQKSILVNDDSRSERVLRPVPHFDGDLELRSLALSIRRDIIQTSPGVLWNDVVGSEDVKRLIKEAIILPRKYPELFRGLRSPWKSILLHGPPGTGKTLVAKAVATESNTVFFNISASSIVSKYRGDSEKLVRVLFDLARYYAPSTIFFDEIDSIAGHRGGIHGSLVGHEGSEHEGSRRMKTELLVQMDGLLANNADVFVLAASNLPWDLDAAFLRRLEKRILLPLPSEHSRKEMIRRHLSEFPLAPAFSNEIFNLCAQKTNGFSGSDIKALCKEVSMRPVRRILTQLEVKSGSSDQNLSLLINKNPITEQDFFEGLSVMNQSTDMELCMRHRKWNESHGSC
eukprot:CCRYP_004906-RA/>CCRYP_004906-RA protein AED:0.31 eAED:-0.05 QI:0/0.5/0/0.66/1/1/3/0/519